MKPFTQRLSSAPRGRRLRPVLLISLAAAALFLFGMTALPRLLPVNLFKDRLSLILSQSCRRPIRLGEVRLISFFPPTTRISNIVIEKRAPNDPVSGAIRSATFAISASNLWNKVPIFSRIELERCSLDIQSGKRAETEKREPSVSASRTFHFSAPMALLAQATGGTSVASLRIENLIVTDSSVSFPSAVGAAPGYVVSEIACVGDVTARQLRCASFQASLAKGRYEGKAEAEFASDGIDFAFDGKLSNVSFEELFPKAKSFVRGTSEATFQLKGAYAYARSEFETLTGSGALVIRDGVFPKVTLGKANSSAAGQFPSANPGISGLTDLLFGARPAPNPALENSTESLRFQSLSCRCNLSPQALTVAELECLLDENTRARGEGAFFYREKPARVKFRILFPAGYFARTNIAALPLIGQLSPASALNGVRVPVLIEGDAAKPAVKIDLSGLLSSPLQ